VTDNITGAVNVEIEAGDYHFSGVLLRPAVEGRGYLPVTRSEYERGDIDLDGVFYIRDDEGDLLSINGWLCFTEVAE